MSVNVGTGGLAREAAEIFVGDSGGAPAAVLEGWVGTGGGAKHRFFLRGPALSAQASPDHIGWQVVIPYSLFESSSDATVNVYGGSHPTPMRGRPAPGAGRPL